MSIPSFIATSMTPVLTSVPAPPVANDDVTEWSLSVSPASMEKAPYPLTELEPSPAVSSPAVSMPRISSRSPCEECGQLMAHCTCDPVMDRLAIATEHTRLQYVDAMLHYAASVERAQNQIVEEYGYETDTQYAPISTPANVPSYLPSRRPNWVGCAMHTAQERMIIARKEYFKSIGAEDKEEFILTVKPVTCGYCMMCDDCAFELEQVDRHNEWSLAWEYWQKNYAAGYVPASRLSHHFDERMMAWKVWQNKKRTNP